MTLIMAYRSAMQFWMQVATSLDAATSPSTVADLRAASVSMKAITSCISQNLHFGDEPYHVLVGVGKHRISNKTVVAHQTSRKLPAGSFRKVSKDVLVASPELCFLHMASELETIKLIEFGWYLCGTYVTLPNNDLRNDRQPLTSKIRLRHYLEKCSGAKGVAIALKALRYVGENSASPLETKLGLLLSLPKKLGGYGFPQPIMNYKIQYDEKEQRLYKKHFVVLDLYWPQWKLGLEYDGRVYHGESDAISHDRQKSSELAARQIEVIRVDRNQVRRPSDVYVLAKKIGRVAKHYVGKPTRGQWEKKKSLFAKLIFTGL